MVCAKWGRSRPLAWTASAKTRIVIQLRTYPDDGVVIPAHASVAQSDCFAWRSPPTAAEAAALRDLRPLLDADTLGPAAGYGRLSSGLIPPATLAPFTIDGRLVGLPYELRAVALLYDQSVALTAGLPADSRTWTLDQLAAARQATVRGDQPQYGFATRAMTTALQAWLEASGVQLVQGSGLTARLKLTSPTTTAALQSYLALLQDASPHTRFVYGQAGVSTGEVEQLISAGQVAFWVDDAMNQPRAGVLSGTPALLAVAPLPGGGAVDQRWLYAALDAAMQGADLEQALATAQQQSDQFSACVAGGSAVAACAQQIEPGYNGWGATAP